LNSDNRHKEHIERIEQRNSLSPLCSLWQRNSFMRVGWNRLNEEKLPQKVQKIKIILFVPFVAILRRFVLYGFH
jgi:hypothetical protein